MRSVNLPTLQSNPKAQLFQLGFLLLEKRMPVMFEEFFIGFSDDQT